MDSDFSETMNRLSENARFALQKADVFSKKYNNGYMGTEHILLGILSQDVSQGARMLRRYNVTLEGAEKALGQEAVEVNGNSSMAMMSLSEAAVLTIRMADHYATEKGAPAGYVGYEDGGKLTEAVRRKPYAVVLFDEIEKAHPEVFNMLLQILEDGELTDGQGTKVKFNNTVVILTSNLGASEMYRENELGFVAKGAKQKHELDIEYEASKETAMRALKKVMKPELINRLDGILVFRPLSRANVEKIFDNLIEELRKRLAKKKLGLKIDQKVKDYLIELGYDPKNGARPLRRVIEDRVESLLAEEIMAGRLGEGDIAAVGWKKKKDGEVELTMKVVHE